MGKRRLLIGLVCILIFLCIGLIWSLGLFQVQVTSQGSIVYSVGIKLFEDVRRTKQLTSIAWGAIPVGSQVHKVFFVWNNGSLPVILSFYASNWIPLNASNYLTYSWSANNITLQPDNFISFTLFLQVSPATKSITTFSANLNFQGTQSTS